MKPVAKLTRWSIVRHPSGDMMVCGVVTEDERPRGFLRQRIYSSTLVNLDIAGGVAETLNTLYELD